MTIQEHNPSINVDGQTVYKFNYTKLLNGYQRQLNPLWPGALARYEVQYNTQARARFAARFQRRQS